MCGVIVGNILINAERYNHEHPIVFVAEAEETEPKEVLIEVQINWTKERIQKEVREQAERYNVPYEEMWNTILCESGASTTVQSNYRYTFTNEKKGIRKGARELSFGIAQIHLPDHPDVTKEQALDPAFAINFMAKNWDTTRWYCRK